tara:strand:- start:3414 stop:4148 length:735 start_codon:yes stop_codon:yes gene_type:complete
MQVRDEKIKGFNLLELIVVIAIIGLISGIGYPQFSKWRKDREIRDDVIRIKSLIEGINAQVQRGQYVFVQFDVEVNNQTDGLIVRSKGMSAADFGSLISNQESTWWTDEGNRCNISDPGYWTDDPDPDRDGELDTDKIEVRLHKAESISTNWGPNPNGTAGIGAICFAKNDRWYSGNGKLELDGVVDNFLFFCDRSDQRAQCDLNRGTNQPASEHEYLYSLEWSRFGNLKLEKWSKRIGNWVKQ